MATRTLAPGDSIADEGYFAQLEYEAWPSSEPPFGGLEAWSEQTRDDYLLIAMAVAVMERDHHGNAKVAAEADLDDLIQFVDRLRDAADRYKGLAEMLGSAELRAIAGIARNLAATEGRA